MKTINDIIESILGHYGADAYLHPYTTEEPPAPQKRRKQILETEDVEMGAEDDPNDNSVVEDNEDHANEVESTLLPK